MFSYEVIQSLNNLELSLYEYIMKNKKKGNIYEDKGIS